MLPADHLWPPDDVWDYHAGGGEFKTLKIYDDALAARYGAPTGLADFAEKSQLMAYEGERAMFEAYRRNEYVSGGVIQWMLNNAWPSLIWHLYDYYLRPAGGYFGTKEANEPVHVMYAYDDGSVAVTSAADTATRVTLRVRVLDLQSATRFARDTTITVPADSSMRVFTVPRLAGISSTYFLDLRLVDAAGRAVSRNFYWLSTTPDEMDFPKSTWYFTPTRSYADFTALRHLPAADVESAVRFTREGADEVAHVRLTNAGSTLAFFVRLQVVGEPGGGEILPVLWEDNYVSLLPGETRELTARYAPAGTSRALVVSGWNVRRAELR